MVAIIREADRDPVAAVSKRHGISERTIYTWRKRFGGLHAADVKRLRQLEAENGRVADEFTKEGLAIDVDGRIRSARVIEVLSRLVSARGAPRFLRSDNGPEFVSNTKVRRH